nr:hypothetical protein Iba_chr13cCG17310 [Ipomoea batatas]
MNFVCPRVGPPNRSDDAQQVRARPVAPTQSVPSQILLKEKENPNERLHFEQGERNLDEQKYHAKVVIMSSWDPKGVFAIPVEISPKEEEQLCRFDWRRDPLPRVDRRLTNIVSFNLKKWDRCPSGFAESCREDLNRSAILGIIITLQRHWLQLIYPLRCMGFNVRLSQMFFYVIGQASSIGEVEVETEVPGSTLATDREMASTRRRGTPTLISKMLRRVPAGDTTREKRGCNKTCIAHWRLPFRTTGKEVRAVLPDDLTTSWSRPFSKPSTSSILILLQHPLCNQDP